MISALYQTHHMRIPVHAAVSEAVNSVKQVGAPWATGLVNATLRRVLKDKSVLDAETDEVIYEHPEWLIDLVRNTWANEWKQIMLTNNSHPPMTLRINRKFVSRSKYLEMLAQRGVVGVKTKHSDSGLILNKGVKVAQLPLFSTGSCSVQDEAAQLAVPLLSLQKNQRILDACAAPGGKTGHIGETLDVTSELVALEIDEKRLQSLTTNIKRLKVQCKTLQGDASQPDTWFDGKRFDRILADVPCSGTGVIRRHPDIRFHRISQDIENYQKLQVIILKNLWPLLKPEGFLLYVTCSILRQENDDVLEEFVASHNDVRIGAIELSCGHKTQYGRQILPGEGEMDGFFFARLEKRKDD